MNFLGLGKVADIEIKLDDLETRKHVEITKENDVKCAVPVFYDGETIKGKIYINIVKKKKLEHQGIKIEFFGLIDMYFDRASNYQFVSLELDLARSGIISESISLPFEFRDVEKPYESYMGTNVNLKYVLKVTVVKRLTDIVKEADIIVHSLYLYPNVSDSLKMEVGIEDCLHIEFEYNRSKYHLNDVIIGKIYFILVRVKIKYMELQIIKQEMLGVGPSAYIENETVAKYEIMDGAPVRGESIPIRLFLKGYDELTPTMVDIGHRFSVKYFLNLVLVDEEDRRYFKQQGIFLYRKSNQKRKAIVQMSALMKQAVGMGFANVPGTKSAEDEDSQEEKVTEEE